MVKFVSVLAVILAVCAAARAVEIPAEDIISNEEQGIGFTDDWQTTTEATTTSAPKIAEHKVYYGDDDEYQLLPSYTSSVNVGGIVILGGLALITLIVSSIVVVTFCRACKKQRASKAMLEPVVEPKKEKDTKDENTIVDMPPSPAGRVNFSMEDTETQTTTKTDTHHVTDQNLPQPLPRQQPIYPPMPHNPYYPQYPMPPPQYFSQFPPMPASAPTQQDVYPSLPVPEIVQTLPEKR